MAEKKNVTKKTAKAASPRVIRTAAERAEALRRRAAEIEAREQAKRAARLQHCTEARVQGFDAVYELLGIEPLVRDRSEKRRVAQALAELRALVGSRSGDVEPDQPVDAEDYVDLPVVNDELLGG